jgi:sec-independent protein translocase protein TatA
MGWISQDFTNTIKSKEFFMGLGFGELIVILLIVVLFFGGKKLPQLGSSLGESIKNFKKGLKEDDSKSNDHKKDS